MVLRIEHISERRYRPGVTSRIWKEKMEPSDRPLSKSVERSLRRKNRALPKDNNGVEMQPDVSDFSDILGFANDAKERIIDSETTLSTGEGEPISPQTLRREILENLNLDSEEKINEFREISNTGVGIFEWFKKTPEFEFMYRELIDDSYMYPNNSEDYRIIMRHFVGAVFESIAYAYIFASSKDSDRVLSPEETRLAYANFFPDRPTMINHPFGKSSIASTSVPDGFSLGQDKGINIVFEYTLSEDKSYFDKKIDAFNHDKNKLGEYLNNVKLVFVTPNDVNSSSKAIEDNRKIDVINLPFSRYDFNEFVRSILDQYQPDEDSATVLDIQKRIREQALRKFEAR